MSSHGLCRALLIATALTAGLLLPQQASAEPGKPPPTGQKPVKTKSVEVDLAGAAVVDPKIREVRANTPFSLVGLKWNGKAPGQAEIRHRKADGSWAQWTTVDPATDNADVGKRSKGSEPIWTGRTDTVQVRSDEVQRLRLVAVDPGSSPADAQLSGAGTQAANPERPAVVSRADWGADESLMGWPTEYAPTTKAVSIHHTAGTNDYTCADSAGLIRAIYHYHAVDMDWGDIGYSALVDKCGTVFEGRSGGLQLPAIGAHTGGFNTSVFGISMLGTFTSVSPTDAQLESVAAMAAWKLGGSYRNPLGTTELTSKGGGTARWPAGTVVTLPVIFGHRDSGRTECPGDIGYGQLGRIRERVATLVTGAGTWNSPIYQKWRDAGGDNSFYGGVYEVESAYREGRSASFMSGIVLMTSHATHGTHWFSGAVLARWRQESTAIGWPTADQASTPNPGEAAVVAPFSSGDRIYYTGSTGAIKLRANWTSYFDGRGGSGAFGVPVGEPVQVGVNPDDQTQNFAAGWTIYQTGDPGLLSVGPPIRQTARETPGLGFPIAEQQSRSDGGVSQRFDNGTVICTSTGVCSVGDEGTLAIKQKYTDMGGGGPLSAVTNTPDGGRYATFAKWGTTVAITWHPSVGAHWFSGAIQAKWDVDGRDVKYGHAVADQSAIGSVGAAAAFTKGHSVYFSGATGAHALSGAVRTKYWELGHTTGVAGYPTTDVADIGTGGQFADFQNTVSIYASAATGAHWISGALRQRYRDAGGPASLGFPTSDQSSVTGTAGESGLSVLFGSSHAILWTPALGAKLVSEKFLATLRDGGGVAVYGFPEYEVLPINETTRFQQFRMATIFDRAGSHTTLGWGIRATWWSNGGTTGTLGLPTSNAVLINGVWQQNFDRGTIRCSNRDAANTCQVNISG